MAKRHRSTNGRVATKPPTIQERVAEMVRLAALREDRCPKHGEKRGRELTPLEEAQHSVMAWEVWSLWEKAKFSFSIGNPEHIAAIVPILMELAAPNEPNVSQLFKGTLAGTELRSARAHLRAVMRAGITDQDEFFRWQIKQQSARNILRRERGETMIVTWEDGSLSGLGIRAGDEIIIMQTLDIQAGDLVCYDRPAWYGLREPDGAVDVGVLRIERPTLYFDHSPDSDPDGDDLQEVKFVGRAVAVHRGGKPVRVPFKFRPYDGETA